MDRKADLAISARSIDRRGHSLVFPLQGDMLMPKFYRPSALAASLLLAACSSTTSHVKSADPPLEKLGRLWWFIWRTAVSITCSGYTRGPKVCQPRWPKGWARRSMPRTKHTPFCLHLLLTNRANQRRVWQDRFPTVHSGSNRTLASATPCSVPFMPSGRTNARSTGDGTIALWSTATAVA